jgi:hypothetical protein
MSFDLIQVRKLEAAGGAVLERYRTLLAACDTAQFGSPDHLAKAEFERRWQVEPAALVAEVEAQARTKAR